MTINSSIRDEIEKEYQLVRTMPYYIKLVNATRDEFERFEHNVNCLLDMLNVPQEVDTRERLKAALRQRMTGDGQNRRDR